ncbi:MAG: PilT/PilU family type 4a pilus ATPase [Planctomycetes bacterium]|nr:PilT/PilU family type 4a pilus ATPase [Planctomycetota bacterium]
MPSDLESLERCLLEMLAMRASDLYLRPGGSPAFRVMGKIVRSDLPAPTAQQMQGWVDAVLPPVARTAFQNSPDADAAYSISGKGRFRISIFSHQGQIAMAARLIPMGAVEFGSLGLPKAILEMADAQSGLILIVGPTGCGKSTTIASLIHHINSTRQGHIITIEDPIEFVHEEIKSLIHQRQVGFDTESFATALRHVVRQSPDVIMIGEMRDADTIQTAMSAALTGHLVLSTLHTTNVVQSVDRMLNYFPPDARQQAQADLAVTLVGMASMRLLPRKDGAGRVPAVEILRATPTVRRIIAENKLAELYDIMKRSADAGMSTLNGSLVKLCRDGIVDKEIAERYAPNRDEFRLNMQGMFTGVDSIDMRNETPERKKE